MWREVLNAIMGTDGKPMQLFQCRCEVVSVRSSVYRTDYRGCSVDEGRSERTELQ